MTLLSIKAFIYRKTGIYLAHREELEYTESEDFWKTVKRTMRNNKSLGFRTVYSLGVGVWQAKHGFTRSFTSKDLTKLFTKKPKKRKKQ